MPYLGEIRLLAGAKVPQGWCPCDGRTLPVSGYTALFSLLGYRFGGDGQATFGLPDLRGRTPIAVMPGVPLGDHGGDETVKLEPDHLPPHRHLLRASGEQATTSSAAGSHPAAIAAGTTSAYGTEPPLKALDPTAMQPAGASEPHENMQPFVCLQYMVATVGIFPSPQGQEEQHDG